jgi:AraC-like DNA-binding protein
VTDFGIDQGGSHQCDSTWRCAGWQHESMHKLYVVVDGAARYAIPGSEVVLTARQIYLIPGGRPHRYACADQMAVWWCHFRAAAPPVERRLRALSRIHAWPSADWAMWRTVWESLPGYLAHRQPTDELRIQALLACLVAAAFESEPAADPPDLVRLAPALRWMEARYGERPDLGAAAHAAGLHPHRFHRVFRAAYGCTPRAWMEQRRMDQARRLLAEGRSVQEAAAACGYDNPFHFSRVVSRHFGRSPSELRERWQP